MPAGKAETLGAGVEESEPLLLEVDELESLSEGNQRPREHAPDSGGASAHALGVRWLRVWANVILPGVLALQIALLASPFCAVRKMDKTGTVTAPVSWTLEDTLGVLLWSVGIGLQVALILGIRRRAKWAWWLNWFPVLGSFSLMWGLVGVDAHERGGRASLSFEALITLLLVLHANYWRKRRSIFGNRAEGRTATSAKLVLREGEQVQSPDKAFITYENTHNPHITIHRRGCRQVKKRGGVHSHNQGRYREHVDLGSAMAYAQQSGLAVIRCSFCNP